MVIEVYIQPVVVDKLGVMIVFSFLSHVQACATYYASKVLYLHDLI